jgi:diguanylate cyclase (GGDEF)-like protein/PAS domain S-box-containing protein
MQKLISVHKILPLIVHLFRAENARSAVKSFIDVINVSGLGVEFRYEANVQQSDAQYVKLIIRDEHFGNLVVTKGSLDDLPDGRNSIINSCANILAVVLEYHSNREKLKSGNKRLQKIIAMRAAEDCRNQEMSQVGSWSYMLSTGAIEWSSVTYGIFVVSSRSTKITKKLFLSRIHPDDRKFIKQFIRDSLTDRRGKKTEDLVLRIVSAEAEVRYVSVFAEQVFDDNNQLIRVFGTVQDVTARKEAEIALQKSHNLLRSIIDAAPMWIAAFDLDGSYLAANKSFEDTCDLSLHETKDVKIDDVLPASFLERHIGLIERCLADEVVMFNDKLMEGEFQGISHVMGNYAPLKDDRENIFGVVSVVNDVTDIVQIRCELQKTEDELHKRVDDLRLYAEVFEHTAEGIVITDAEERILEVNRATEEILGFTRGELLGKTPRIWRSMKQDKACYKEMWDSINNTGEWQGELWNRRKNGTVFPARVTINVIRDKDGWPVNYISIFSDITNQKRSQERLDYLAHHDPLTELPNRLLFNARLEHAIKHASRKNSKLALLFLDLDRFKLINDGRGHKVGDELLKAVGERLASTVRMDDSIARIGGDEFTILVEEIEEAADAALVAEKILKAFTDPFVLLGNEYYIGTSIGISIFPDDSATSDELVQNADIAMYRAKDSGRNGYAFYSENLATVAFERVLLESSIKRALERDEFILNFQPQIEIQSGKIIGMEVLVRWEHPEMGVLGPTSFIQSAEDSGMMTQLSQWILHKAMTQGRLWLDQQLYSQRLCVNVATADLADTQYEQNVVRLLDDTGFPASNLELEVKESIFSDGSGQAVAVLERLKQRGVNVTIDNFGTGYSSLLYLKQLPIDRLKIDRSFIRGISGEKSNSAVIKAVIGLASSLGLSVTAEGVETEAQKDFLMDNGNCAGQGFYFARPMSKDDIERKFDA